VKGIAIDFTGSLPVFSTGQVDGFGSAVQNALVNIGTKQGSDVVFPDKGTTLQADAVAGKLVDLNSAQHSSNFAAVDTVAFSRTHTETDDPDGVIGAQLEPADFDSNSLLIDAIFTAGDGRTVGVKTNL
jgi:hypothetical protein